MTYTLRVISRDGVTVLATVKWIDGEVKVCEAEKYLRAQFEIWARRGLHEIVGPRTEPRFRDTSASDPEFLPRVADNIKRQTGLMVSLSKEP